jgi:hypothetical protein
LSQTLNSDKWLSTQETSFALLALSQYVMLNGKGNINITVTIGNKKQTFSSDKKMLAIPLTEYGKKISIINKGENNIIAQIANYGKPLSFSEKSESNLIMKVHYSDLNGNPVILKNIKQNQDIVASVYIKHPGILPDYTNMALTQIFPSGFEITNPRMDNIQRYTSATSDYQDIKDDRVITYFSLNKNESKTFYILLNAAYAGEYFLPPVKCEAMYDGNIYSISESKKVNIIR